MAASASIIGRLAASLLLVGASSAVSAAPKKAKKPPAEISIENGRGVALTAFEIGFPEPNVKRGAKPRPPRAPVAKLDAPLAAGETKTLKIKGATGCSYMARWAFEDAGDEGKIDLCGDPKIVLTD